MGKQAKCGIVLQAPTSTQQPEKVPSPWWACRLHLAPGSLPCGTYRQHSDVKVHHTTSDTSSPAGQLARGQALPWAANRRQAVNPTGNKAGRDVGHCHCNFAAEDAHTCPALDQSQFNSLPYSLVKENKAVKGVRRGPLGLATPVHHLLQAREPLVRAGDQGGVGGEQHAVLGATLQQEQRMQGKDAALQRLAWHANLRQSAVQELWQRQKGSSSQVLGRQRALRAVASQWAAWAPGIQARDYAALQTG